MKNTLKILSLIGLLIPSVQAMEIMHPFEATDEQIKVCTYCPETLYRSPIKVSFMIQGDSLRGETVRVTCSDARSVLLTHNWHGEFCKETYAVMPGSNTKTLEEPSYVDYNNLPNCYDAFKERRGSDNTNLNQPAKLVKTYNFGEAVNLNGVSIKVEETENQDVWKSNSSEWAAEFDFYPWSPGVLSHMALNKDVKNESSLFFEINGNIAGVSVAKFSSIHPYQTLIASTDFEEAMRPSYGQFATVCYDGKFKENPNSLFSRLDRRQNTRKPISPYQS